MLSTDIRGSSGNVLVNSIIALPELIMETGCVVLTSESVNKILWCDHSNETSFAVLLHSTTCFSTFHEIVFGIFLEF